MRAFPRDFAELLSPRGRRLLDGRGPWAGALAGPARRFVAIDGVLDARKAERCRELLERALGDALSPMEEPIPPEATWAMTESYSERLPKTVRVRTALLESRRSRAFAAAQETGLHALLRSESFRRLAGALVGRPLRRRWGIQVLRYGVGDYAGPHNDHDPEEPDARDGYLDVHLSFSSKSVAHQWLVYERGGHLSQIADVATVGGLTAYRLPLWHYATPLAARRGRAAQAHRWVMLGTFLYETLTGRDRLRTGSSGT